MFSLSLFLIFCLLKCSICEKIENSVKQKEETVAELKLSEKTAKNLQGSTYSLINNTNVRHYVHYYLRDRYGYYIRWDGRKDPSSNIHGLTVDQSIDFEKEDWYLFILRPYVNDVYFTNVKTGHYLTHDWPSSFCLWNYYNSSGYPIRMRLQTLNSGNIGIQSEYYTYPYYLSTSSGYYNYYDINYLAAVSSPNSSNVAHLKFIPLTNLSVKISSFSYTTPSESTIKAKSAKLYLISPTIIENNNSTKLTHQVDVEKSVTEKLSWKFSQNLDFFRNISITGGIPSLISKNGGYDKFQSNFPFKSSKTQEYRDIIHDREYSIKKTLEMSSKNVIKIESFVNQVNELGFAFSAAAEISGEDEGGQLSGSQIRTFLTSIGSYTFLQISSFSVRVQLSGTLYATFGLNDHFYTNNTVVQ